MKCAECSHLDLSTPIARRWAAVGMAVCAHGLTPADCGAPTLSMWPVDMEHKCPASERLSAEGRREQGERLERYRNFLESKRNDRRMDRGPGRR